MRRYFTTLVVIGLLTGCTETDSVSNPLSTGTDYDVYFLGGQSNMGGFGFESDLPDDLKKPYNNVRIYAGHPAEDGQETGGLGFWGPLSSGFGVGFHTDGKTNGLSDRFGPELSFAARLQARAPERNTAIIKYSRGGTSLALGASPWGDWSPDYSEGNGRNQYDNALTAISTALKTHDIDGDGRLDRLTPRGIIWMQGEADAGSADTASAYEDNLTDMMERLRAALHVDDLPVVLGQIRDSGNTPETRLMPFSPDVIQTQNRYAETDPCATIVTVTEGFEFQPDDGWHYVSENYLELGEAFADAVLELEIACGNKK